MINFDWNHGERVRELRRRLDLRQDEFGAQLGVSRQTVNSYENNRQPVPLAMLQKICELFDVSPYWILTGIGGMHAVDGTLDKLDSLRFNPDRAKNLTPEQKLLVDYVLENPERAKRLAMSMLDGAVKLSPSTISEEVEAEW